MLTIPNILTLLRIALIPVLCAVFYWQDPASSLVAAGVFGLAALTDWVDGYLARKLQQMSNFGAFLDPVADKLMVAVALVLLVADDPTGPSVLVTVSAAIIIGREIVISALREWMAELGLRATIAVSMLGKVKTTFQMLAIFFMLLKLPYFGIDVYTIGLVLLQVAALLTLLSMIIYIRAAWPYLRDEVES